MFSFIFRFSIKKLYHNANKILLNSKRNLRLYIRKTKQKFCKSFMIYQSTNEALKIKGIDIKLKFFLIL